MKDERRFKDVIRAIKGTEKDKDSSLGPPGYPGMSGLLWSLKRCLWSWCLSQSGLE